MRPENRKFHLGARTQVDVVLLHLLPAWVYDKTDNSVDIYFTSCLSVAICIDIYQRHGYIHHKELHLENDSSQCVLAVQYFLEITHCNYRGKKQINYLGHINR